jgi:DNA-binding NarL/FixJ family response regulator
LLGNAAILIVEDEPLIALELKASVEDAGGKVVDPVGSAEAALELLQTDVVAAAILDVQLEVVWNTLPAGWSPILTNERLSPARLAAVSCGRTEFARSARSYDR